MDIPDIRLVTTMITITVDGQPRGFTATATATPGQEGLMMDMCWEQTRKQAETALKAEA